MTTKTDITLPPLPRYMDSVTAEEFDRRVLAWGCAAVEADRQVRMPSDEELLKVCESAGFLFHYDRYAPGSGHGLQSKAYTLENFRALLTRYSSDQPVVCHECGGDGAGGLHEDDCSQNSSVQPAASAEPVYAFRRKGQDEFVTCGPERFAELQAKPHLFETRILYAAPVAQEPLHITHGPLMREAASLLRLRRPVTPDFERVAVELEHAADGHPTPAGDPSPGWLHIAALAAQAQPVVNQSLTTDEVTNALARMDALLDPASGLLTVPDTSATVAASRADLALIRAALAQQPSGQDREDAADMFWDADDPERFGGDNLHDTLVDLADDYGDPDFPVTVRLQCAKRLPDVQVVVTGRNDDGELVYEVIDAARAAKERT